VILCAFSFPSDSSRFLFIFAFQSKKINKKVMGMIEKAEGEYTELLRKRKVVENDKKKIHNVIEELDVKKKSELERTWVKVTKDFGSIFSTLLPGASAKLEPPEGQQAWQGLEVKVAFGDVWKDSLSELSGGQRSLLALSLILSLLLFKPAPMYILDEVDAALDLSHTQNIGNMLKTHFSQSQFIVVSLKVSTRTPVVFHFSLSFAYNHRLTISISYRRVCSTTPM
jgi:structural maintenance of chromosome 2